jgi:hypothetical protein
MKIKRKIVILSIILLIISSYKSIAINSNYLINPNESAFENNNLWAVLITVGEPKRDNKNAGDLYNILINHGWNGNNIYYLKENEATKEAILNVSNWLNDHGADEDDLILFFFSMHGGRKEDIPPLDEPDNMDEFLIPYQQEKQENNNILDEELALMFEEIKSKNLVIIFETCFSGGMIDGANDLKKSGRVVLTSSREDESSYPIFLRRSWLFPFYFIRGLKGLADKNFDGYITAEEAFEFAKIRTVIRSTIYAYFLYIFHKELLIQHPQIYDGWPSEENNEEELKLINFN